MLFLCGPSHGQSLQAAALTDTQCGSISGAPALFQQAAAPPALLSHCRLVSSGCNSGSGCSSRGIHGLWPSGFIHCSASDSSIAACGALLHAVPVGLSWAAWSFCSTPALLPSALSCLQGYFSLHFSHFTFQLLLHSNFPVS